MKRKMLIIANPGERDAENYCEGVNQDVPRYHRFFTSIQGGAWKTDEIKTLIRPEPREVDLALSELKSADYSMVIFCGHGYSRKTEQRWSSSIKTAITIQTTLSRAQLGIPLF